ncbi:hypothetical protein [Kribbella solani]|uniref:Fibronectin type III domain-containing protein n=1 Tax=Kribbella solani TaxID=236067 RepID=A0A841DR55_9ACTN|nr:hypothetical protein [Kribbella solani]MBB5981062.1 hypothetical protein [Kribbella solani]MDX2971625.1 hypothetical protein [Kribbella solani]MDX3003636.1 hypothetical protein [Kribbella solani]
MRKTLIATAALALLAGTQVPAWAATPTSPADVRVSWSDAASRLMRVTWTDDGAANKLRIEYQGSTVVGDWLTTTDNDFNHRWSVQTGKIARIAVVSTSTTGDSTPAYSPWFDTNVPAAPKLIAAVPQTDGSLRLSWSNSPLPADTTPNDPLDAPASSLGVGAKIWSILDDKEEYFPYKAGTTTAVVPARRHPQYTWVLATNEWGSAPSMRIDYTDMKFALSGVPRFGVFGKPMTISGLAGGLDCQFGGKCRIYPGSGVPLTMQTRASASKPWAYAGRYTSYDLVGFQAESVAVGGREYRFYAPSWKDANGDLIVTAQAISESRYIPTLANFAVVGFNVRTAQVGQLVKLTVDVRPGGTVKGALQRWDGKYWRSVLTVPITKGKAVMYVRAAGRGTTTSYRVAVPGMTYYGLPIQTTGSRSFTLSVR